MTRWPAALDASPLDAARAAVAAARREIEREATNLRELGARRLRRLPERQALVGAQTRHRAALAALQAAEQRAREVEARRAGDELEPVDDDDDEAPWVRALRRRRAGL